MRVVQVDLVEATAMLGLAEAKLAVDVLGGAIGLFDKLYPRLTRILTGAEPTKEPSIRIEKHGEKLVAKKDGAVRDTVTYQQLMQRLTPDDVRYIQMYESSIRNYEAQIEQVYPQLAFLGPIEKAQTEARLKQMVQAIRKDLLGILGYVQTIGLDLDDHYSRTRDLIARTLGT
jgi:hypothetical protein